MPNAIGSRTRCGVIPEVTQGTTPANPINYLRITGGGPNADSKQVVSSNELGLVATPDEIMVGANFTGTINGELTYGVIDLLLPSVMGAAFVSDVIALGLATNALTIGWQYNNGRWIVDRGAIITSLEISVSLDNIVTFTAQYTAMTRAETNTAPGTGTPVEANTNPVMGPIAQQRAILEGGANNLLTAGITALSLTIARQAVTQRGLGTTALLGLDPDKANVTGSLTVYYPDGTLIGKSVAHTMTSLAWDLGGASTLRYEISLPQVYLSGGPANSQAAQAVAATFNYNAVIGSGSGPISIERVPA
jgi:hypothetical protein